ncbi:MAG: two-component system sensor histidine kinase NtrB [Opitutales bacterium]|jgi:two-component system cell cycle sensor histidine kinase/response regulator CckA
MKSPPEPESVSKPPSSDTPPLPPKQDSEDLWKLEAMLHNAKRFGDIAKLAGDIAHDLNNLLAPIRIATELLKQRMDNPDLDRYVDIIEISTGRARSVIQEILAFSRESETADRRQVDVNPLLKELEGMTRETFPPNILLQFEYHEGAPVVEMDPNQLHRSILNLIINARDAISGDGSIHVRVSIHNIDLRVCTEDTCLAPRRYLCISVKDTGCGIKQEIRDQIFDPFFTTKPKEKGTGLGLASVFGIVARAGGFIDLESEEDKGSTFHIFLPESSRD